MTTNWRWLFNNYIYMDDYCEFRMTKSSLIKCGCALNELLWQLIDGDFLINYIYICGWLLWIQDDKNATNQMWVCLKWIVIYILPKKIIRGLEPAIDELSDIYYQRKLEGVWSQPLMTSRLRMIVKSFTSLR